MSSFPLVKCYVVLCQPNRQEALLAAISEKDANIALLELSSSKKKKTQDEVALLKREKDRLVQQLKQQVGPQIREGTSARSCCCRPRHDMSCSMFMHTVDATALLFLYFKTQNRMKLMADNYEDDHLKTAPDHANHKPSPDQVSLCEHAFPLAFSSFSKMLRAGSEAQRLSLFVFNLAVC